MKAMERPVSGAGSSPRRMKWAKPVIGLAGGIGSGKSLVARQLESLGCAVIDADDLARQSLDEPEVREQVRQWWGDVVIGADGSVDRQAVARVVFDDDEALDRLEALVHPRVHEARHVLRERHFADDQVLAIVEDCPLLLEKGIDAECDVVLWVAADRDVRLGRLARSRGWTAADLVRREKNQLGLDIKSARADYMVANNAGEPELLLHVRRVFSQILEEFGLTS